MIMSCFVSLIPNSFTARPHIHSNSNSKYKHFLSINFSSSSSSSSPLKATALSEGTEGLNQKDSPAFSGYGSDGSSSILTIRHLLAQLIGDRDDDFSIQLVPKNLKKVSAKFLTTSQKRNIRRQAYLNEVSQRNDSVFFATIGGVVILTPVVILGIAILTGYVQLFP